MEIKEAIQILKEHNVWRRFDDENSESPEMTDPKKLGIAIDKVVSEFENLFISGVIVPKGTLCRNCGSDDIYTCFLTDVKVCNKCHYQD